METPEDKLICVFEWSCFLSVVTTYFELSSIIAFSKTEPNFELNFG